MTKAITLLFIFCFLNLFAMGQEPPKPVHYIGLHGGTVTGLGFSYRYWPKKIGFQVTAIPLFKSGGEYFISSGITMLYELNKGKVVDLYGYLGNHLINTKNTYNSFYPGSQDIIVKENTYNIGVGIGFKINFLKVLDFNLQGGYGLYDITNNFNTNMAGEAGLYYHF